MARILIADDHAVARRGLKEILLESYPSSTIATVPDSAGLLQLIIREEWDLVISDISMPGRNGIETLEEINKQYPHLPVLILSVHPEEEYAVRAIKAGASGYLTKDDAAEDELIAAVDTLLRGRKYITASIAERLAMELSQDIDRAPHETLSNREFHVFRLMAQGKTTGEIAEHLSLSVNTIGTFRSRILAKMNMKSNADLIVYAVQHKLV